MLAKILGILNVLDLIPAINDEIFPVQGVDYTYRQGAPTAGGLHFTKEGGVDMVAISPNPFIDSYAPGTYARKQDGWYATKDNGKEIVPTTKLDEQQSWKVTDLLIRIFVDKLKPAKQEPAKQV